MKAFIKKHEFNYIKKCLFDLNNTFRGCVDANILAANKAYINEKILNLFENLSDEEREILDINKVTDPLHIDKYLANVYEHVYGMDSITKDQILKVFKKEKKLKLPDMSNPDVKNVYLGWIDEASRKLFIAYNLNGKLLGMACRLPNFNSNNTHICTLCNYPGKDDEVAFVSPLCKPKGIDDYKSLGFDICLDSAACNERIMSTENLERLLKNVNNLK